MASPPPVAADRLRNESQPAWEAYCAYRDLGFERSLEAVARKLLKSGSLLRRWSARYNWVERVARHDGVMDGIRQTAARQAEAASVTDWVTERESQRARELDMGQALIAKAKQMLEWPLAQRRLEQDGKVTIVEPARWRLADAAKMLETGSKLVRLAAEMETDRVTLQVEAARLAAELGIPVEDALAEVEAILAERGVRT